jgi:hypothetical protein
LSRTLVADRECFRRFRQIDLGRNSGRRSDCLGINPVLFGLTLEQDKVFNAALVATSRHLEESIAAAILVIITLEEGQLRQLLRILHPLQGLLDRVLEVLVVAV